VGLKLNGTHQLLAYADDANLLVYNVDTVKKNTKTLLDTSKEAGIEISVEKTKYMLLSCHKYTFQDCDIKQQPGHFEMCHSLNIWELQ
jgi:hypothetical protein